jgi:hypothetical protein
MLAPLTLFICYKYKMRCLITMSRIPLLEIGIQEDKARDGANHAYKSNLCWNFETIYGG